MTNEYWQHALNYLTSLPQDKVATVNIGWDRKEGAEPLPLIEITMKQGRQQ